MSILLTGIDETQEVLDFARQTRDTFLDGVQAADIMAAPALVTKGIRAYRGADKIPAELADLDANEREVLGDQLEDLFGPILDGIVGRIEAAIL